MLCKKLVANWDYKKEAMYTPDVMSAKRSRAMDGVDG